MTKHRQTSSSPAVCAGFADARQERKGGCDGQGDQRTGADAGVNVFRRFAFMKGLHEVEQVSFDRMVDPADEHRLHDSDWATQRLAWALKLAIVGGLNKARSVAANTS